MTWLQAYLPKMQLAAPRTSAALPWLAWQTSQRGEYLEGVQRWLDDAALANTKESKLRQTTPVDMYPDGATPASVCDLAGNVWEWTADARDKDRDVFWLRGGSWYHGADRAWASAASFGFIGGARNVFDGFRLVCVPISHG